MRLVVLGTNCGAAPVPGRNYVSFAVERDGGLHLFDAGENCSQTACFLGLDLLSLRAVFISHCHLDHTGGLPNLLWNLRRLAKGAPLPPDREVPVFIPNLDVWRGALALVSEAEGDPRLPCPMPAEAPRDGVVYEDGRVRVTARHNEHLGRPEPGEPWLAFSYLIESDGKRVAYSGDCKRVSEFADFIEDADLVLMEAGHHKVDEVCLWLRDSGPPFGRLALIHLGRAVLEDPEGELAKAKAILGDRVLILDDAMIVDP